MIIIGHLQLKDLAELRTIWTRDGDKYTSPDGNCTVWISDTARMGDGAIMGNRAIMGDGASMGDGAIMGDGASMGNRAIMGDGASMGDGAIMGNRAIMGDGASMGDRARMGNYARMGNDAIMGDGASMGDGCDLPFQPLWFHGPQYPIGVSGPGMVTSGCITKPIQWWEENVRRCAEEHGYSPDEISEYAWRVKIIAEWMKRWNVYEIPTK